MQPVDSFDSNQPHYVLPHHAVLRQDSSTTKLPVVFDASAKSSTRVSLNNILMVGPTVQQDHILTLLSFRLYRHTLTADITKMYRQLILDPQGTIFLIR